VADRDGPVGFTTTSTLATAAWSMSPPPPIDSHYPNRKKWMRSRKTWKDGRQWSRRRVFDLRLSCLSGIWRYQEGLLPALKVRGHPRYTRRSQVVVLHSREDRVIYQPGAAAVHSFALSHVQSFVIFRTDNGIRPAGPCLRSVSRYLDDMTAVRRRSRTSLDNLLKKFR
jgi:hypothetical protein